MELVIIPNLNLVPNTPTPIGKGCVILRTTKDIPVTFKSGRFVVSCDASGVVGQTKESGKTYVCNVSRKAVDSEGNIYDINFQILMRNSKVVTPKEVKKPTKLVM